LVFLFFLIILGIPVFQELEGLEDYLTYPIVAFFQKALIRPKKLRLIGFDFILRLLFVNFKKLIVVCPI